jgi:Undecaprenyl-phosphate galactose phosphotransferase WbaP
VTLINPIHLNYFARQENRSALGAYRTAAKSKARARICTTGLVGADVLGFVVATFIAFVIDVSPQLSPYARALLNIRALGFAWHGWGSLLIAVCLLSYFGGRGHYTSRVPFWTQMGDVVVATFIALACDIFLTVAIYDRPLQPEGLLRWALLIPALVLSRAAARQALRIAGVWSLRTLIVAPSTELEAARAALLSDSVLGYTVAGTITFAAASGLAEDDLLDMIAERGADFVVIAGGGDATATRALTNVLRRGGLPIALLPTLRGIPVVGFRQHYFLGHDIVMLVNRNNLARPVSRALKLLFDQVAAMILILLLGPLMLALTLRVRAADGPAFYRHRRIGSGGREFQCLKFRTMVGDADQRLRQLLARDPRAAREWAATQKLRDDPRITRIGQFLRRSSLDELPQLFNVLRGEMSLVGPRPIVRSEIERYGADIEYYFAAKPGITGLWQVSGRSDISYDGRVKLDVWYVRNWTLWHDIVILFRTVPAVFLARGGR